jgi:hypothetical protein
MNKIVLCFKCPDAKHYAVKDYVNNIKAMDDANDCLKEDWEYKNIEDDINSKLDKWIKYGELLTIEVDLENNTARVCQNI